MWTSATLAWGSPGAPLLPASLREIWSTEQLPSWVISELSLAEGATLADLDSTCLKRGRASARIEGFLAFLLRSRMEEVRRIVAIDRTWPASLHPTQLGWRVRTCNCFRNARLDERLRAAEEVTFGDLLSVKNAGPLTVLDMVCTLEAVLPESLEPTLSDSNHSRLDSHDSATPIELESVSTRGAAKSIERIHAQAAEEVQSSTEILQAMEEPWVDLVSERDPRFADLLPTGAGTIFERIDHLTSSPEGSRPAVLNLAHSIRAIRNRIATMDALPLEVALREYLRVLSKVGEPKLDALLARMHWNGAARPIILEDAGASVGVTRERMRQIQARAEKNMPPHAVVMPALDRALSLLLDAAPLTVEQASELLVRHGISVRSFHPASVLAAAVDCGRQPAVQLTELRGSWLLVALPDRDRLAEVARNAARQVASAGVGSVLDVVDSVSAAAGEEPELEGRRLLNRLDGIEFLTTDWFRFRDSTGGLLDSASRKMLAVTTPLDVGSLREGIKRAFRFRETSHGRGNRLPSTPPREVLAEYYRAHPDFVIATDGHVRPAKPLDLRAELGRVEQTVVNVLRSSPSGVMHRTDIIAECTERGVNFNTLAIILSYSPFIQHLGASLWMLRGTMIGPAVVETLRREGATRQREKRVVTYGWTNEGRLWIAFQLTESFAHASYGAPAAVARYIVGRDFNARTDDGKSCGVFRVYDNGLMSGHSRFLRRSGADAGDVLLEEFDLSEGTVTLTITDDDAIEERESVA